MTLPAQPTGWHVPLGQRLLLIDAHIEEHRLDPQQHPALELPRQGIEQGPRQGDPHIEAVPGERAGGGRGGTGNGHTTQEHLLASAGESGLALFRDFLTASHRPERGVKLCYRLQLAFLMECNTAKQERRVCAHDEHQLKFWASSENQKNVSTDFL